MSRGKSGAKTMTKRGVGLGPNRNREPGNRTVRWGKHYGKRMRDVPGSYLRWFVRYPRPGFEARRIWCQQELDRRLSLARSQENNTGEII
jgi:hypothetical protein